MRSAPSPFISPYAPTIADQLYRAQSDVIRDLSEKESFVIVGRCSNSVLEDREDVLNVFVYAPLRNQRPVHRVMESEQFNRFWKIRPASGSACGQTSILSYILSATIQNTGGGTIEL
ncbi:MAG: AAA family ATPase [Coprococcus sp.]